VSGQVLYHANQQQPLADVDINAMNLGPLSTTTDTNGNYTLLDIVAGNLSIEPSKSDNMSGAVNSMDASAALEAAADIHALTPTELLGCDVTGNGSVSGLDASMILQFTVAMMAHLPVAEHCDSDFLFLPNATPLPGQTQNQPVITTTTCLPGNITFNPLGGLANGQNFLAVAIGDCAADWQPGGGGGGGFQDPPATAWIGPLHGTERAPRLPLYVQPGTSFKALDVVIHYDAAALVADRIRFVGAARGLMSRANLAEPGIVRIGMASANPIVSDDNAVLVVHFTGAARGATQARVEAKQIKINGRDALQP
jgi:hypothetical protein